MSNDRESLLPSRRRYTPREKLDALSLIREIGVTRASRRLGISPHTLSDWRAVTQACAHSPFVGRGRTIGDEERQRILAQLIHEQELEERFIARKYRHNPENVGGMYIEESLDVRLSRTGIGQRHLIEWLDPTFEEASRRLAA